MDGLVYDAHTHTSFSDGKSTAQENVRAAEACGLSCVALTDHLYPDTNHDDVHTWVATAEALDAVSRVTVVSGLEASILDTEGALSVGAEEAAAVRFVLADMGEGTRGVAVDPPASIKRYEENLLAAMSNAAQNPVVDAIAHPFNLGRFDAALTPEQLSRSGLRRLAGTMADSNVAFEIMNEAHWWYPRMPVAEFTREFVGVLRIFAAQGVKFVVGSDARCAGAVGNLRYCAKLIELAGIELSQLVDLARIASLREQ